MTKLDGGMTRLRPRPVAAAIVIGTAVLFIFGLQPIILQPVNFEGMYMQRLQQQAESGAPTEVPIQ